MDTPSPTILSSLFGPVDLFWLDQILKGNVDLEKPILDAGCGDGKNIQYLIRHCDKVYGVDRDAEALLRLSQRIKSISPSYPVDQFVESPITGLAFEDAFFASICCIAVLHFANDESHFFQMLRSLYRVLQKGGILMLRYYSIVAEEEKGNFPFLPQERHLNKFQSITGAATYEPSHTINRGPRTIQTVYLRKE